MTKKYMTRHEVIAHAMTMAAQLGNGWKIKVNPSVWWEINAVRGNVAITFSVYARTLYRATFIFEGEVPVSIYEKGETIEQAHEKLILRMKKLHETIERNLNGQSEIKRPRRR